MIFDKLLSRPVSEWFDGWDEDFISRMYADSEFSDLGPRLHLPVCRTTGFRHLHSNRNENPKYPGLEQVDRYF